MPNKRAEMAAVCPVDHASHDLMVETDGALGMVHGVDGTREAELGKDRELAAGRPAGRTIASR